MSKIDERTRFTTLDTYVLLDGELHPLIRAEHDNRLFFLYRGKILEYDGIRDGEPLDIEVVLAMYPEFLI
jgi:hypothetical protein